MDIDEIVALSVKHNAADLHLCSGNLPQWRCQGRLSPILGQKKISTEMLQSLASRWLDINQNAYLESSGHVDFAVTLASGTRLRANLFQQRHGLSLALRLITNQFPATETLGLPDVIPNLLQQQNGLILITGATGSGKSTTLAVMINMLNQQRALHILTLEDPIEFIHNSQQSLIQQREIGQHCRSFHEGLRAALREAPDVILLGELRDSESIRLALTAAETGHLVLATLHTRGAAQAIDRLVDVFPAQEKHWVCSQLAGSLKAVIAQRLVPGANKEQVALFEVLVNTPAVANLIREGKNHQLPSLLQTGRQVGMHTFAQSLHDRIVKGMIIEGTQDRGMSQI